MNIFEIIFYQPIFNLLVYFYNLLPDFGLAIIAVTITIKLILLPLSWKTLKAQKALQILQPKIQELQKKYKGNKEHLAKATMELYKKEKVNPFSSCLPLLIQLPFLFAMFRVLRDGFKQESLEFLYNFVNNPGIINPVSAGFMDLSNPYIPLAFLAGAAQFWQARMLMKNKNDDGTKPKEEGMASMMGKQMMYMMPILTVFIGFTLPGGLTLYWLIFTLLTILQQHFAFKEKKIPPEGGGGVRIDDHTEVINT